MLRIVLAASAALVVGSTATAGVFERIKERREARHTEKVEIIVQKDGTPALRWSDGSISPVTKGKEGLVASPKKEAIKTVRQKHGPDIAVPAGK